MAELDVMREIIYHTSEHDLLDNPKWRETERIKKRRDINNKEHTQSKEKSRRLKQMNKKTDLNFTGLI